MNDTLQLFGAALTLPFLVVILRMVRRHQLRAKYSFLWVLVGTAMLALALIPGLIDWTAEIVGVAYPPALLFIVAIMLLLFLSVHFSWELTRLEDRTRTLVEELALANARIDDVIATQHPTRTRRDMRTKELSG